MVWAGELDPVVTKMGPIVVGVRTSLGVALAATAAKKVRAVAREKARWSAGILNYPFRPSWNFTAYPIVIVSTFLISTEEDVQLIAFGNGKRRCPGFTAGDCAECGRRKVSA